ncbi:N-ethylammeline chlorohydrolase [Methylobacillus sp. MM3]|uniref:TRZ/ATZ family hydrolase n=1 Tax=Methylobacillus sp. MM3 TaxID=1848039 RepID=UPI0007E0E3E4|nr:TRZ/ATZ family hydrolase [Methylobacillus sp. MM3]OAJ71262.1 N-ethylammeline chlorohydrolase [Methylobacillus sp. MM3]
MESNIFNSDPDLVIEARWVIPVRPGGVVMEHAAVIVHNGRIEAILPVSEARQRCNAKETIRLPEHVLLPGLINAHTHAAMTLMRGLADDRPLMDWLGNHIWPAEGQVLSERFVRDGTLLACAEMLKGGVTTFNDMYFFPEAAAEAVNLSGMRAALGLVVLDFPSPYAADADDYLNKGFAARDALRGHPRITTCLAPHAPYTVNDRIFNKVLTYADQLGANIHLHLHETHHEIEQGEAQYGMRPVRRLTELGLMGPNVLAAHCVHMTPIEIETLALQGAHVAHCPGSNLKLGSGIAPVADMLAAGINVALGSDGAASNNRLDMFAEMRLAALLAKASGDAEVLPAMQVLEMATINGARALGMDDNIGSLEHGKLADMIAVDFSAIEMQPCYDPISHLVYVAGREHVSHAWVAGELCYERGIHAHIDPAELKEIATLWQGRLKPFHQ